MIDRRFLIARMGACGLLATSLMFFSTSTIKPWVKAEPSSHIWVERLTTSLEAGTHTIDVHVSDEYGRDRHDRLVLEVTG